MLVLAVTTARRYEVPAILLEQSKYINHLHAPTLELAPIPATCGSSAIRQKEDDEEFADSIDASLVAWRTSDQAGQRAIPGYFIIPGAPRPPTAAWNSAVSSGVANLSNPVCASS